MKKEMSTTYTVICPYDKKHKFEVVIKVDNEKKDVNSSFEEYCPFCDKYVQVTIEGELKPDRELFRRFDFD